jgi:Flp pilus assembly protein TadG
MPSIVHRLERRLSNARGAELIELAVALPILLLIIGGIVDFAILFQRFEVVTNAAREGARMGTLAGYSVADIQDRATSYLTASGLTDAAPAPTVAYGTAPVGAGGGTIDVVTVTVQYPHAFVILGPIMQMVGGSSLATITLSASSTMRREVAATP